MHANGTENPRVLLDSEQGRVRLWEEAFNPVEAEAHLQGLLDGIEWQTESIAMFGKIHEVPRRVAWHGDADSLYTYAGVTHQPEPWGAQLLSIKERLRHFLPSSEFNSVLLNLYRSGNDRMGWHRDNERELGPRPVIASVSFGVPRRFDMRHVQSREKIQCVLPSGSLLVMDGAFQEHWQHQLPASKRIIQPRVNLTFRTVNHKMS